MRSLLVSLVALASAATPSFAAPPADAGTPAAAAAPASSSDALGTKASPEDDKAVRAAFLAYQGALEKKDGKAAAALVDSATVQYYGRLQKLALEAPAAQVRQNSIIDKLMVLRMRAEFAPEQLRGYTPEQLIAIGVDRGWVGDNMRENEVGDIFVNGNVARARALVQGEPVPMFHEFHKEDGRWKLSVVALTRAVGPVMSEAARRLEQTEDEFVMFMLEQGLPKKPGPEIWDAPKPTAKKPKKK